MKKGFASMTIVYSFLLVFLLTLVSLLAIYTQKARFVDTIVSEGKEEIKDLVIIHTPTYKCYTLSLKSNVTACYYSSGSSTSVACYTSHYYNALNECRYQYSMSCWQTHDNTYCYSTGAGIAFGCTVTTCGSGDDTTYGYFFRYAYASNSGCYSGWSSNSFPVYTKTYYNNGAIYASCPDGYAWEEVIE